MSRLKGFESHSWFGFVVRAGTPPDTVRQLNGAVRAANTNWGGRSPWDGLIEL